MSDVTQILAAIERGEATATEQLLPAVYHEMRRLAETANPELFSLLQNYRYQSRERAREVWTLLEAVEYQEHSVRLLDELRKKCEELR